MLPELSQPESEELLIQCCVPVLCYLCCFQIHLSPDSPNPPHVLDDGEVPDSMVGPICSESVTCPNWISVARFGSYPNRPNQYAAPEFPESTVSRINRVNVFPNQTHPSCPNEVQSPESPNQHFLRIIASPESKLVSIAS